jgi:ABC-type Mn2+/Zn2+ transport system permease subunit
MSLKTAAFFALIGMILLTVLDAAGFLRDLTAFLRGAVAAISLLEAAIHLLASLGVTVFLFVFYRAQA